MMKKECNNIREGSEKVLKEFGVSCGWCVSLFLSQTYDSTLHLLEGSNMTILGHHHSLLLLLYGKVICYHRCKVVTIHNVYDWDKER